MESIFFNRKEICRLPLEDYHALKRVSEFWGLSTIEETHSLIGRLGNRNVRVIGLNRKEMERLKHMLQHTGVTINTHSDYEELTLSIFKENSPESTIIVESSCGVYRYQKHDGPYSDACTWIYKDFHPLNRNGGSPITDAKLYWNPDRCEEITEWLAYLILQATFNETSEAIKDISPSSYERLLKKVLTFVNPVYASYQLKPSWPEKPSFLILDDQKHADPIDPFKYNTNTTSTNKIDPFKKQHQKKSTKVINPFFKK